MVNVQTGGHPAPAGGPADVRGTCFGFEVLSRLPFRYLRGGRGEALSVTAPAPAGPLDGDRLLLEWSPPRHPFRAELYSDGRTFRLWVADAGWFRIDPRARTIEVPETDDEIRREERIWGIPSLLCFVERGDVPVHAAAVQVGDGAVLLAAPGGFGKTTLAAAFAAAGCRVLAEDLSCVRLGERPVVVPGPAMMRVRRDVAREVEISGALRSDGTDDRVHVALDRSLRGDCTPVPLRAVVFLRERGDGIAAERATANASIADLWALSFHLPTDQDRTRTFAGVADLASAIECWNLARPVRFDALPATLAGVVGIVEGSVP